MLGMEFSQVEEIPPGCLHTHAYFSYVFQLWGHGVCERVDSVPMEPSFSRDKVAT